MSITQEYFDEYEKKLQKLREEYGEGLKKFLEENHLDKVVFNKRYKAKGVFKIELRFGYDFPVANFYKITAKGVPSKVVCAYESKIKWIEQDYEPVEE